MAVYAIKKARNPTTVCQSRFKKQVQEARFVKVLRERRTRKKSSHSAFSALRPEA